MHISSRTNDLQSLLATHPGVGGYAPWSTEAAASPPIPPRPTVISAARDDEIVAQDDKADYCYLVLSGCARTVRLMQDGRRQVGEFLFAGDVFGWDALDSHDFGVEAVTPVVLHRYSRRSFVAFADSHIDLCRWIRELTSRQACAGRAHMILLGRMTASERIASFLLEMAERMQPDASAHIELPMSRADIADYLGLTIETVSRRLTQLRLDGTITVQGAKIAIRNRRTLENAGCGMTVH